MEVYFNRTSVHRNSLYGIGAAYMILFFYCKINGAFCFCRLRIFRPHGREKRLKNRACFPFAPGKRVSCQVQIPGLPGAKGLFARCKQAIFRVGGHFADSSSWPGMGVCPDFSPLPARGPLPGWAKGSGKEMPFFSEDPFPGLVVPHCPVGGSGWRIVRYGSAEVGSFALLVLFVSVDILLWRGSGLPQACDALFACL